MSRAAHSSLTRISQCIAAVLFTAGLAACGSPPPDHFYALNPH